MYNGEFNQCIEVTVTSKNHSDCLHLANILKKQCDAWSFNVRYNELKSARKGDVLKRTLMIYQQAYASDIVIFREAIRRICFHYNLSDNSMALHDHGIEPLNNIRNQQQ